MRRLIVPVFGLMAIAALPIGAQQIRGRLTDETTGVGVENASVALLDDRKLPVGQRAISNTSGLFIIPRPPAGRYRLEIQRIGYAKLTTLAFEIGDGADNINIDVYLVPQMIEIDPFTLEVRALTQLTLGENVMDGFNYRARNGFGHYITREKLDNLYSSTSVMAVLRTLRGISISRVEGEVIATANRSMHECGVKWWLDGRPLRETQPPSPSDRDTLPPDEGVGAVVEYVESAAVSGVGRYSFRVPFIIQDMDPEELVGIEVYNGVAGTPAEFTWSPIEPYCAAVVLWTKVWERRTLRDALAKSREQRTDTIAARPYAGSIPRLRAGFMP